MARWMLICPGYAYRFEHSNVDPATMEGAKRDPFRIVAKPRFADGETIECPSCNQRSVYHAFELVYSGDETALRMEG